ncbi:hypothetical protein [Arthrobacter sp. K5]|uniref:Uncharacterized protein n=1 Tax=Arthrobacter sp. K5 TaxID=2839623 RepID=A0AAU8EVV1_9MICC
MDPVLLRPGRFDRSIVFVTAECNHSVPGS